MTNPLIKPLEIYQLHNNKQHPGAILGGGTVLSFVILFPETSHRWVKILTVI